MVRLLRLEQWIKNLFIFLPLFFNGQLHNISLLYTSIIVFAIFSLLSSAIYCFNDIKDVEQDRLHPEKKERPIASGVVSVNKAIILSIVLLFFAYLFTFLLPSDTRLNVIIVISTYLLLQIFYTIRLKEIAVLDVLIISVGFVLRVLAGGVATNIALSHWIILMTFLLALLLAFAKRRDDQLLFDKLGKATRNNTKHYNIAFIDQSISIVAAIIIVCYIMYTLSAEVIERFNSDYIYVTSIFVIAGILRYVQIVLVEEKSGNPTNILLKDVFIQSSLFLWFMSFMIMIYCR